MINTEKHSIGVRDFILPVILVVIGLGFSYYVVEYPQDSIVGRFVTYKKIWNLLLQHIYLVIISGVLAIVTSVPIGILLTRPKFKKYTTFVVNLVNIGQTVPSLAVLALFVTILGIGSTTAIFALWLYSLLPILNNTLAGIMGVSESIIEAAKGMGMRPLRILRKIEIPLALPVIMAGIRTAIIINIGTATLGTFVGAGGLGDLIVAGNNIDRWQILVAGALTSALLAVFVDHLLALVEVHLANS